MATPRFVCLLLALSLAAFSQPARSVDELVSFVKSSVQRKDDDKRIAEQVQRIRLSNRLDPKIIEDLQHQGAGPKTVAALQKLAEASAELPGAAPAAAPKVTAAEIPPPDAVSQKTILSQIQQNALNYTQSLPNYICTQVTKRHVDPTGREDYRLVDTIQEQLSFFEQKETYTVKMVNDRPVTNNMQHDQLGGARSSGEFGSLLRTIFDPDTQTEFTWERWTTLAGRRTYVWAFRVTQHRYQIHHDGTQRTISVGYHGQIFADEGNKSVMRIQLECDGIPADFAIQSVKLILYYDIIEISGQNFVLPRQSEIRSREGNYLSWNETSYHNYHKYGADASISFGGVDDTPPEKPPVKKK